MKRIRFGSFDRPFAPQRRQDRVLADLALWRFRGGGLSVEDPAAESSRPDGRFRPRSELLFRPRRALCPRRRPDGRGRGADGRGAAPRPRRAGRLERGGPGPGPRRAQGPDHEGGAAPRHDPGPDPAGIRGGAAEAAERGAADGGGLRQAADAGRARARLAGPLRLLRPSSRRRGLPRAGAPGDEPRRRPARLQAPVPGHAVGRGGRPRPARDRAGAPSPARSGDRHPGDRRRDRRPGPRGARLQARGEARGALRLRPRRHPRSARAGGASRPFDAPALDARLARRREDPDFSGPTRRCATGSRWRCSRPGGTRSATRR